MNKKFTAFFTGYGMETSGNFAYGKINGFETNAEVRMLDTYWPLVMHISFYATDEQRRSMEAAIRNLKIKFFKMSFSSYGLALGFNDMTYKRLLKRLPAVLDSIYAVLTENGALNAEYCPVCGNSLKPEETRQCNVDGFKINIDNNCADNINSVIAAENKDFANAPNNYLKGFLGAFIGGLAGAAISIVLNIAGFVSAISAMVSIVLGAFLYQKFHGKPNKMMIVIVSLTTLVMLAATIPVIYIVAAGIEFNKAGISMSAIEAFKICMQDTEIARMFYLDLALVVVFSIIGTVLEIFVLAKQIKRRINI